MANQPFIDIIFLDGLHIRVDLEIRATWVMIAPPARVDRQILRAAGGLDVFRIKSTPRMVRSLVRSECQVDDYFHRHAESRLLAGRGQSGRGQGSGRELAFSTQSEPLTATQHRLCGWGTFQFKDS